MIRTASVIVLIALLPRLSSAAATPADPGLLPARVEFNRDIRPILSDTCFACHGPDEKARKAKLRLDLHEGILTERDGIAPVVPRKLDQSELYRRIITDDPDDLMPPTKSDRTLTPRQIGLLKRWIEQGAEWEGHWAFIPPKSPAPPVVQQPDWERNPIDGFILARLEQDGLKPSPEADRATLIRRVSFDLTGLPPTPAEVDTFLADTSADAYDRLIRRLLASPRYGERMALPWLDLARYADTHGYHLDSGRDMWKWREWVINAFQQNKPFNEFTVEQIAGDLLPNATLQQQLATGFNRNSMINFEGGAIPEEYLTQYIIDRVATTSTAFLGLTMACAQCHDHKYDPITQKDFYRFYAYFNAVPEKGLDGSKGNATPIVELPTAGQRVRLDVARAALKEAEQRRDQIAPEVDAAQAAWEQSAAARRDISWTIAEPFEAVSQGGATLTLQDDHSVLASGTNPAKDVYEVRARTDRTGITAIRLEALTDDSLPDKGPGRFENSNFVLTGFELDAVSTTEPAKLQTIKFIQATADYEQEGFGVPRAIDNDATTGWAVDGPKRKEPATAWFSAEKPFGFEGGTELRFRLRFEGNHASHTIGRARLAFTTEPAAAATSNPPPEIAKLLAVPADERNSKQRESVQRHFRENISSVWKQHADAVNALRKEVDELTKEVPTSMVMRQMENPRDTFVLVRGEYNLHGEKVTPGVPASLPSLPEDAPPNRLALAGWLVSPENPLMARVTVNRFWQMIMGTGLVKTANDFGSQGEWPSHPELLDWLATEFVRSGWDTQHVLKLIVSSATYRQSSMVSPELLQMDPYNRLYARGPRFRLSAEEIRDNALAVSGLLVEQLGGPSVSPYQPAGLWEDLSSRKDSKNWSAQFFVQSHGPDLYRRSMYTFWKRTSPPPSLTAFDAPDRETCTVARERTSTPLQALILMNDPTYTEASRILAERMMTDGGTTPAERITFAFRRATTRPPTATEIALLHSLYEKQLQRFQADREAALQLLAVGEFPRNEQLDPAQLAAWTNVASTILNLDETINKG